MKPTSRRRLLTRLACLAAVCLSGEAAAQPPARAAKLHDTADTVRLDNLGAGLVVAKAPWRLSLLDADGRAQFTEARPPSFQIDGQWVALDRVLGAAPQGDGARLQVSLANGGTATVDLRPFGPHGFKVAIACDNAAPTAVRSASLLDPVEEIYGFGEMWNGHVAQRGQSFELWDQSGTPDACAYMPYYVSTRNYACFLDYGGRVRFDVGQRRADEIICEIPTGRLEFTVVSGDSIATTVQHVLTEVGLPARPPRWAFEPWSWLMSDPGQPAAKIDTLKDHHFIEMIEKLHALDIPVGVTWFEPPWQTARTTFVPNPAFTQDIKGLVARLRELGVHTLAWTVPYTLPTASNYQEAGAKGYLVRKPGAKGGNSEFAISNSGELIGSAYTYIDYYNPDAVAWWQSQIAPALDLGLSGFKLDDGQGLQTDAVLHGGRIGRDYHNAYAYEYNRTFGEILKKKLGDDYLTIPRAAWLGSSAWSNFKWPGDLSGSFANNGLPSSVYSSLSLAFCGVPFVSSDIGGFMNRPAPEEVWIRWAQFGAMIPGMQNLHMPWHYSKKALDHFRYLSWLHTDLIPLWNSLAHEAAATGAPVIRPLVWTFQDDIDCWRVDDEFTVGDSLLVAPFINPERARDVYLPPGRWFDFWDEKTVLEGGRTVRWFKGWEDSRWKFPLYVREGAIIPMEIVNDVTGFGTAASQGFVTLALWPKAEGESRLTLHDREGPVPIQVGRAASGAIEITFGATRQNYLLRVRLPVTSPLTIQRDGVALREQSSVAAFRAAQGDGWFYDADRQTLWVRRRHDGSPGVITVAPTL